MEKETIKNKMVFVMRIDADTKMKIESLSANDTFRYNNSKLIKFLINESFAKLTQNENN